jgi:hypothetical protein
MKNSIIDITKKIITSIDETDNSGLYSGKMGIYLQKKIKYE